MRYETCAAALLTGLDALGPAPASPEPATPAPAPAAAVPWTRRPTVMAAGALLLLVFGVIIGINASRLTERDETPPGARLPVPAPGASSVGPPTVRLEPGKPIPHEMLAGMLQAARQSLFDGNYSQAIAAYQAVLKRDAKNVDALTHMGLIVAIGGHADVALLALVPKGEDHDRVAQLVETARSKQQPR